MHVDSTVPGLASVMYVFPHPSSTNPHMVITGPGQVNGPTTSATPGTEAALERHHCWPQPMPNGKVISRVHAIRPLQTLAPNFNTPGQPTWQSIHHHFDDIRHIPGRCIFRPHRLCPEACLPCATKHDRPTLHHCNNDLGLPPPT
jgi:hypothetical protein